MEFFASDVTKITGVKRNRLQQWLERGWITPSIQVASGHGTRNIYSRLDLVAIALFKKITESGLSRKVAAHMVHTLYVLGPEGINNNYFIVCTGGFPGDPDGGAMVIGDRKISEAHGLFDGYINPPWTWPAEIQPYVTWEKIGKLIGITSGSRTLTGEPEEFDQVIIFNLAKVKNQVDTKIREIKG